MKDTFRAGQRVMLSRVWQRAGAPRKVGTIAEYDSKCPDNLVPVKWDDEPFILFPERGVLERISNHECDGLPCYDATCPNAPRPTVATSDTNGVPGSVCGLSEPCGADNCHHFVCRCSAIAKGDPNCESRGCHCSCHLTVATFAEPTLADGILAIVKMRRERIEDFSRKYGETQFDQGRIHELKHIERVIIANQEASNG